MTRIRALVLAVAFAGILIRGAAAAPLDPNNPAQGRFSDEWAEIYMAGGKVGYAHSTMAREGDLIHTGITTEVKLGRDSRAVTIRMVQRTTETLPGVPVSFSSEMEAAIVKTMTKGTVNAGRVTVVTSQYGMEQTQTYDYPQGAMMAWGMFREGLLRGFIPGTEYTLAVYTPELWQAGAVTATTKIGDFEEFEHRGKRLTGQKVTTVMTWPAGTIEAVNWVDKDGWTLKAKIPVPGLGDMMTITTDQSTALADFIPPELFTTTVIKVGKRIDAQSAQRIKYRIRAKQPGVDLSELPNSGMQTVTSRAGDAVELVVARQPHRAVAGKDAQPRTEDLREYLDANLMINTADPMLIELAKKAAGGETEPFALADKLRRFVTDYVAAKTLNVGFATASEVSRTKEGDCTEHSVLLAALGRLNNLPSRVVVGLAYVQSFGKQTDIFGYHAWTQFHIDGRWVDFDAALRESDCSPTRIAFAASSLKNSGLADLTLPLLSKIGAIDIDILQIDETAPGER
jgi:hypothetical protein